MDNQLLFRKLENLQQKENFLSSVNDRTSDNINKQNENFEKLEF